MYQKVNRPLEIVSRQELLKSREHCRKVISRKNQTPDSVVLAKAAISQIEQELILRKTSPIRISPAPIKIKPAEEVQALETPPVVERIKQQKPVKQKLDIKFQADRFYRRLKTKLVAGMKSISRLIKLPIQLKKQFKFREFLKLLPKVGRQLLNVEVSKKLNREHQKNKEAQEPKILISNLTYHGFDNNCLMVVDQFVPHNHDYKKLFEVEVASNLYNLKIVAPVPDISFLNGIAGALNIPGLFRATPPNHHFTSAELGEYCIIIKDPKPGEVVPTPIGYEPFAVIVNMNSRKEVLVVPTLLLSGSLGGLNIEFARDISEMLVRFRKIEAFPLQDALTVHNVCGLYPRCVSGNAVNQFPVSEGNSHVSLLTESIGLAKVRLRGLRYSLNNWLYEFLPEHTAAIVVRTGIGLCDQFSMAEALLKRDNLISRGLQVHNGSLRSGSGHAYNTRFDGQDLVSLDLTLQAANKYMAQPLFLENLGKLQRLEVKSTLLDLKAMPALLEVALSGLRNRAIKIEPVSSEELQLAELAQVEILDQVKQKVELRDLPVYEWMSLVTSHYIIDCSNSSATSTPDSFNIRTNSEILFSPELVAKNMEYLFANYQKFPEAERLVVADFLLSQFSRNNSLGFGQELISDKEILFPQSVRLDLSNVNPQALVQFIAENPKHGIAIIINLADRAREEQIGGRSNNCRTQLESISRLIDFEKLPTPNSEQISQILLFATYNPDVIPKEFLAKIMTIEVVLEGVARSLEESNKKSVTDFTSHLIFLSKYIDIWDDHSPIVEFVAERINIESSKINISNLTCLLNKVDSSKIKNLDSLSLAIINTLQQYRDRGCPIFSFDIDTRENHAANMLKYLTEDGSDKVKIPLKDFHNFVFSCHQQGLIDGFQLWGAHNDQELLATVSPFIVDREGSLIAKFPNGKFQLKISPDYPIYYCLDVNQSEAKINYARFVAHELMSSSFKMDHKYYDFENVALLLYFGLDNHSMPAKVRAKKSPLFYEKVNSYCRSTILPNLIGTKAELARYRAAQVPLALIDSSKYSSLENTLMNLFVQGRRLFHDQEAQNNSGSNYNSVAYTDAQVTKHFGLGFLTHLHFARTFCGEFSGYDLMRVMAVEIISKGDASLNQSLISLWGDSSSFLHRVQHHNSLKIAAYNRKSKTVVASLADRVRTGYSSKMYEELHRCSDILVSNRASSLLSNNYSTEHGTRNLASRSANYDIRRYQSGDLAASINWKASAKSQSVMINSYRGGIASDRVILVDYDPSNLNGFLNSLIHAAAIFKAARGKNTSITIVRSHPILSTDLRLTEKYQLEEFGRPSFQSQLDTFLIYASELMAPADSTEKRQFILDEQRDLNLDTTKLNLAALDDIIRQRVNESELILISHRAKYLRLAVDRKITPEQYTTLYA